MSELLKRKIKESGLKKSAIAKMVNVSQPHFTMMLNSKATMPEDVRNKVNTILNQALKITV